jgi:hypothetical protein
MRGWVDLEREEGRGKKEEGRGKRKFGGVSG